VAWDANASPRGDNYSTIGEQRSGNQQVIGFLGTRSTHILSTALTRCDSEKAREARSIINKEDDKVSPDEIRSQTCWFSYCLLCRRLVEIQVCAFWSPNDLWAAGHADNNSWRHPGAQVPKVGSAYATLDSRPLATNVGCWSRRWWCFASEFGRTPSFNATAGANQLAKVFQRRDGLVADPSGHRFMVVRPNGQRTRTRNALGCRRTGPNHDFYTAWESRRYIIIFPAIDRSESSEAVSVP